MEKLNYPVKYALLPVKARRKNKEGEEFFIVDCYIISKVYVMEEHRKYLEDGSYGGNYKVCFPYLVYSDGINYDKKTPIDYKNNNVETVFYLYDTYLEALAEKDNRNVLVSDEIVKKYKPFEDEILELTKDMFVEKEEKSKIRRKI